MQAHTYLFPSVAILADLTQYRAQAPVGEFSVED